MARGTNCSWFGPTQLEAQNNPHHLPSPPCLDSGEGGLALRLDALYEPGFPESAVMVREYIHREIPYDPRSVAEISAPGTRLMVEWGEFMNYRDEQFNRYRRRFGKKLVGWDRQLPRKEDFD
jgi:hypothetical protein